MQAGYRDAALGRKMTSIIHDFKSIRRKLERQEQKAEYEANNPKEEQSAYQYLYGTMTPLKSMAHPEWPYAGTPFEWSKFVNVKPVVLANFKVKI
jgi:hypothetical protein